MKKKQLCRSMFHVSQDPPIGNRQKNQTFWEKFFCCNLSLELRTKARACKVTGQKGRLGVRPYAPRSARECEGITLTFPRELPHWELESRWTPNI